MASDPMDGYAEELREQRVQVELHATDCEFIEWLGAKLEERGRKKPFTIVQETERRSSTRPATLAGVPLMAPVSKSLTNNRWVYISNIGKTAQRLLDAMVLDVGIDQMLVEFDLERGHPLDNRDESGSKAADGSMVRDG